MPQFAKPEADITNEGYLDQAGGSTNIFNSIDEASTDDNDFIASPNLPTDDVYVTRLSDVLDPVASDNHVVRYRYQKSSPGATTINLITQLRQAYVNEGVQGLLIASQTKTNISDVMATGTLTLSAGEADSITDYTNLYLRFVFARV